MPQTLFDKLWAPHVVADLGDDWALLHIDRVLLHDMSGARALTEVGERGYDLARPDLVFATPDHAVSSAPGRSSATFAGGARPIERLRQRAKETGIRLFDLGQPGHGIVHVMAPELAIVLPGTTLVCGDSHTCTNGGVGALAFGIGASELTHVLATQTLMQRRPRTMRLTFTGTLPPGVTAKDMILAAIGQLGTAGGTGFAVEYAGEAVRALSLEARLTLCNLSIEMGAKMGFCAPDETTFAYLKGRRFAPTGAAWDAAVAAWRALRSDDGAVFDREVTLDAGSIAPQITWGTSPEQVAAVTAMVPQPGSAADRAALEYIGLEAGQPLIGTPVDWVFIGSCTNSRLSDLRDAAAVLRGRKVAPDVTAWVVPGSETVKREAEAEGLHTQFLEAGFQWREPGCALCVCVNGESVPAGKRSVSTSNRNFVGRQGTGARTHLASPAMAAAAALAGAIVDVRSY
jgi:3-isopropylmalate/(R)-2-methylmalate dehydratase large subunit